MDVDKYRKLFLEECREYLQGMNRELLRLESEKEAFDGIDSLFRDAHSIKGMAGSMGYDSVVSLSHAMEDVFDGIRRKSQPLTPRLSALLFEGVDILGRLADEVEESGNPAFDVGDVVGRLRALTSGEGAGDAAIPDGGGEISLELVEGPAPEAPTEAPAPAAAERVSLAPAAREEVLHLSRQGKSIFRCRVSISRDTPSLTARNFVVLGKMNKAGEIVTSDPTLAEVMEGRGEEAMEAWIATDKTESELAAIIDSVPELTEVSVKRIAAEALRAPVEAAARPGSPSDGGAGEVPEKEEESRPDAARSLIEKYLPRKSTSLRVDTRVLDDLINIVGELIINRDRLLEVSRPLVSDDLHLSVDRLNLLVRRFQDTIMAVRMMPLEIVTDRLPRIVRDLARRGGKDISFEVVGQGIELDRAILEEINGVLIHLARNAIDHGMETVEERRAAGKKDKGLIRLSAGREKDWVWIAIEDDGRGMDAEKIRRAALKRGAIDPARLEDMERRELLLLSCLPGLSTAEQVSDISGRGVGMDVVKSKVESFGGSIQIDSVLGAGTTITLRLPLTLAIVQVLLVEVGGDLYGVPVSHVAHTIRVDGADIEWSRTMPVARWGKLVVPLADLGARIGLPEREIPREGPVSVVLAEHEGRFTGLVVDRLAGAHEVVIKPLGLPLKNVPGLAGATIMGDGRTVLILDIKSLAVLRSQEAPVP